MTASQLAAIRELRAEGWAVILWTPEELNGVHPSDVEDMSISYASEYLIPAEENNLEIDLDGGMSAINEQEVTL
jgi:hypothetical protein